MADPALDLQTSARRFGRYIAPHMPVSRVSIQDYRGEVIASLPVHGDESPVTIPAVKPGWDFGGGVPRFDGTVVPIHGKKLDLLRLLAESSTPLTIDGLRAAWDGYPAEEGTIRWTLGDLRRALREQFPGLEEPIPPGPNGYTLAIR